MQSAHPLRSWLWMAALCAAIAAPAHAFEDPDDLPEGPGREETFFNCIACHSFQVVVRQGMSRPMWDDTLRLMVERHGMWELDEDERQLVLDYLSEHFPPTVSSGTRRGWVNPFAP
jgi:hypothetical protein